MYTLYSNGTILTFSPNEMTNCAATGKRVTALQIHREYVQSMNSDRVFIVDPQGNDIRF